MLYAVVTMVINIGSFFAIAALSGYFPQNLDASIYKWSDGQCNLELPSLLDSLFPGGRYSFSVTVVP